VSALRLLSMRSFVGVVLVIARWRRHPRRSTLPAETLTGATVAAIRYVRYSPGLRTVLVRSGLVMLFASGLLALLPALVREVSSNPTSYGFLLGSFCLGAVLGALVIQRARARWSAEAVVAAGDLQTLPATSYRSWLALAFKPPTGQRGWSCGASLKSPLAALKPAFWAPRATKSQRGWPD
jgi:Transmembrane secretion effector